MRFQLNPAQEYYWQRKTRRNIILKARQKGISKIVDADQLVDCIRTPTNAVVISHEKEATQRLFDAVRNFTLYAINQPRTSIDNKSEIKFPMRGSTYFIGTAGQRAFGRGDTVQRAHLSEAAFYPDLEKILAGIAEAAEYGQIDIESTPNGRDQFYNEWQKAKLGKSSYTPIFIPWFIDAEYSKDSLSEKERRGLSAAVQQMFNIPDDEFLQQLTEEEIHLVEKVARDWGIVLTAGQLKWRRYKIWDKGALFYQEYPEDDVSCFLQSGRSVFTQITTDETLRVPMDNFVRWQGEPGRKTELKRKRLFGGLDGAEGVQGGDNHCFSVIDIDEKTGKGVVIFELWSNEPLNMFDERVARICRHFDILLGVEKNGIGSAHCVKLEELGVEFEVWDTNSATRPVMISELEEAYRKAELVETYPEAENEARDMVFKGSRPEHRDGKHDDRIFSRAIAWQMRKFIGGGISFLSDHERD